MRTTRLATVQVCYPTAWIVLAEHDGTAIVTTDMRELAAILDAPRPRTVVNGGYTVQISYSFGGCSGVEGGTARLSLYEM